MGERTGCCFKLIIHTFLYFSPFMTNSEIADYFSLLSKLMDIHGENSFKSKSYSITAFNIENLTVEIETMDDAELFSVKGIGDAIGKKIKEILQTGKLSL